MSPRFAPTALPKTAAVMAALCLTMVPALADDATGHEEIRQLTLKAVALIARDGLEKAHDSFEVEGPFKHGEVYVNVLDLKGVWRVYPPKPVNEGRNVLAVQDADGHFLVKDIIALAKDKGEGWVTYRWPNPATGKVQKKTSYIMRVPGEDLIAYAGVYE